MKRTNIVVILSIFLQLLLFFNSYAQKVKNLSKYNNNYDGIGTGVLERVAVPPADIPVLENALGDMNQDGVVNIKDLLRLRDIVSGQGQAPTLFEKTDGDFDLNLELNNNDVSLANYILLRSINIPHGIDSTGGKITGGGITVYLPKDYVDTTAFMSVEEWDVNEIEKSTNINFKDLQKDKTYFMSGFDFFSTNKVLDFPDSITINLNSMPPCSLQGQNLLMHTDIGPFGQPQLIYGGELELRKNESLHKSTDVNQAMLITFVFKTPQLQINLIKDSAIPGGCFELEIENASIAPNSMIAEIKDGGSNIFLANPVPYKHETNDIKRFHILAPPWVEGSLNLRVKYLLKDERWSNSENINLLRVNELPSYINKDSIIVNFFSNADIFLSEFDQWLSNLTPTIPGVLENSVSKLREFTYAYNEIKDYVVQHTDIQSIKILSEIYYANDYAQKIQKGIDYLRNIRSLEKNNSQSTELPKFDDDVTEALDGIGFAIGEATAGCPVLAELGGVVGVFLGLPSFWNDMVDWSNEPDTGWNPDPPWENPYEPRKFCVGSDCEIVPPIPRPRANICLNYLDHNTNTWTYTCNPYYGPKANIQHQMRVEEKKSLSIGTVEKDTINLTIPPNDLRGAIVTANNGAVGPVVGIINEMGVAAVPGIKPNTTVTYSIYDPKTGFYDPDAGSGTSPNIAEQGVWFPVFLSFEPNREIATMDINIGEIAADIITSERPRIEYLLKVTSADTGKLVNIGVRAEEPLTVWLQDPSNNFFAQNACAACDFEEEIPLQVVGNYKITITYGSTGGSGPFTLGVQYSPCPSSPFICGSIPIDSLYSDCYEKYTLTAHATIESDDTLHIQQGTIIEFRVETSITANGTLLGTGTSENPIILAPENAEYRKSALSFRFSAKSQ